MPSTKGPAKGFLKKVCINSPATDKPEPTKIAVIAFGKRKFKMIVCQLSFVSMPPVKMFKMSWKGIGTEPKLMFKRHKNMSSRNKSRKGFLDAGFNMILCLLKIIYLPVLK